MSGHPDWMSAIVGFTSSINHTNQSNPSEVSLPPQNAQMFGGVYFHWRVTISASVYLKLSSLVRILSQACEFDLIRWWYSTIIRRSKELFAANTHSQIYHYVEVDSRTAKTVCGLRVAMILESEPVSAALHLVSAEPRGYSSCAHCRRMSASSHQILSGWFQSSGH